MEVGIEHNLLSRHIEHTQVQLHTHTLSLTDGCTGDYQAQYEPGRYGNSQSRFAYTGLVGC